MALDCSPGKQIFFNLVEGYFQSFMHIYISDPALCWLFIYFIFLVLQINLKNVDGWSIQ